MNLWSSMGLGLLALYQIIIIINVILLLAMNVVADL